MKYMHRRENNIAKGNTVSHLLPSLLDFRVPVSYSRTIIVFVGIRYKHLRVHDERSESLYT